VIDALRRVIGSGVKPLKAVIIYGSTLYGYGGRGRSRDVDILIVASDDEYSKAEDYSIMLRKEQGSSLDIAVIAVSELEDLVKRCDPYAVSAVKFSEKLYVDPGFVDELLRLEEEVGRCIESGRVIDYILEMAQYMLKTSTRSASRYARIVRKALFYLAIVYIYIKYNDYPRSWAEALSYKNELALAVKRYSGHDIDVEELREKCTKASEGEDVSFTWGELKAVATAIDGIAREPFVAQVRQRLEDLEEIERHITEEGYPGLDKVLDYVEVLGALVEHAPRLLCFKCTRAMSTCRGMRALELIREVSSNRCMASSVERVAELRGLIAILDAVRIMRNISYHEPIELGFKALEDGIVFYSPRFMDENLRRSLESIGFRFHTSGHRIGIYVTINDLLKIGEVIKKPAHEILSL